MAQKIRLIALDLDGTTLRDDSSLSAYNYEMMNRAYEAGIHIAVASGRPYAAIPKEILDLPFVGYAISSNGAALYDATTRERMHVFYMNTESVRKIVDIVIEEGGAVEGFIDGVPYSPRECVEDPVSFGATHHGAIYIKETRTPVDDVKAYIEEHIEHVDCVDMVVKEGPQKDRIWHRINEEVEHVLPTSSTSFFIEVMDEHAGKASMVSVLADKLGIRQEEVAAFGNADNDLDMILWAGVGVAVANSPEHICQQADEVTESNEDDGVGKWIARYME